MRATARRSCSSAISRAPAYGDRDLIFCDELGGPIHPSRLTTGFARHREAAGIPTGTLHTLRHTAATLALTTGVRVHIVAARLGDNPTTVLSTYAHLLPQSDEMAAERVAALLDQGGRYGRRGGWDREVLQVGMGLACTVLAVAVGVATFSYYVADEPGTWTAVESAAGFGWCLAILAVLIAFGDSYIKRGEEIKRLRAALQHDESKGRRRPAG